MKRLLSHHKLHSGFQIVLLLICLLTGGCIRNEFNIKIELPAAVSSTYRVAYYASSPKRGLMVEAAVAVAAGKGELKCATKNPTVVYLYADRYTVPSCVIFAERGDDIVLKGDDADPLDWTIEGNKTNKLLTEWRLANKDILKTAISRNDAGAEGIHRSLNAKIAEFVEAHADSPAAFIILGTYFDSSIDAKEFKRLLELLDKEELTDKYSDLINRQDMLTATQLTSTYGKGESPLKDIIVKSYIRNIDTLRLKSGGTPTLMYFWSRSDEKRRVDIDSLRRIAAWRGDSARIIIADFCLDSDSTAWVYPVQSDSLKHTLRAWAPRGFADPDLMAMGVASTPWWIVAGADGKIVYAGADGKTALRLLRPLKK